MSFSVNINGNSLTINDGSYVIVRNGEIAIISSREEIFDDKPLTQAWKNKHKRSSSKARNEDVRRIVHEIISSSSEPISSQQLFKKIKNHPNQSAQPYIKLGIKYRRAILQEMQEDGTINCGKSEVTGSGSGRFWYSIA